MGKSHSKNNEMLVYGYVRRFEKEYYIPESISTLCLSYYPDCNIYGIGRNGLAEFGLGDYRTLTHFELLSHMTQYCDHPRNIHVGDHRFLVNNIYNEVYCAGKNVNNDCGHSGPEMQKSLQKIKEIKPKNLDQFITVVSNGISARHTFVAFNDNTIHAFGWNQYGQFGNGKQNAYADPYKTKLNMPWSIIQIACGQTHSLFLTSQRNVYCAGMNNYGQCGLQISHQSMSSYNLNCILQMIPIPDLVNIVSIAAGKNHSLFLNDEGKVFCCGSNQDGQLGIINNDLDNTSYNQPFIQETLENNENKIGIIYCGCDYSLFIDTTNNEAYLCGNNIYGQIGNNKKDISHQYSIYWFRFKDYTNKIIDGSCGMRHTVLITKDRDILLTFGSNTFHQCSVKSNLEYIFNPYILTKKEIGIKNKNEIIERVLCGIDTTIIATKAV